MKRVISRILGPLLWLPLLLAAPIVYIASRMNVGISFCRKLGFHPVRLHYYQPIPRYEVVPDSVFREPREFPGFDIDATKVRATLSELGRYGDEAAWTRDTRPLGEYSAANDNFGFSSAALLHAFIRSCGTRKVIEIGGGYSSLLSLAAMTRNHGRSGFEFICVEPYPTPWLQQAITEAGTNARLIRQPVEQLDVAMLTDLTKNDILFIDSSHCVRLASDVNFLYLQVIPRLAPGVIIHIHDIYIPYEYPKSHFFGPSKIFWNEQYLLQALLTDNPTLEVILPAFMAQTEMSESFAAAFPHFDPALDRKSSSFWLRKLA